jgi:hypothetical protein
VHLDPIISGIILTFQGTIVAAFIACQAYNKAYSYPGMDAICFRAALHSARKTIPDSFNIKGLVPVSRVYITLLEEGICFNSSPFSSTQIFANILCFANSVYTKQ